MALLTAVTENCSGAVFVLCAFQEGIDRHGVAVAHLEVFLEPLDDVAGFDVGGEFSVDGESFLFGEFPEVGGGFAGIGLDVSKVGLEGHGFDLLEGPLEHRGGDLRIADHDPEPGQNAEADSEGSWGCAAMMEDMRRCRSSEIASQKNRAEDGGSRGGVDGSADEQQESDANGHAPADAHFLTGFHYGCQPDDLGDPVEGEE